MMNQKPNNTSIFDDPAYPCKNCQSFDDTGKCSRVNCEEWVLWFKETWRKLRRKFKR